MSRVPLRRFVQLETASQAHQQLPSISFLQWNILADSLSAKLPDLGNFFRAKPEDLDWTHRLALIEEEIGHYDTDIVALQELDLYEDVDAFMREKGYESLFLKKSTRRRQQDGAALFWKAGKLRLEDHDFLRYDRQVQVAIVARFSLLDDAQPFEFIAASTHLKASKNEEGEAIRRQEAIELASFLHSFSRKKEGGEEVPVVILGDFNAGYTATRATPFHPSTLAFLTQREARDCYPSSSDDRKEQEEGEGEAFHLSVEEVDRIEPTVPSPLPPLLCPYHQHYGSFPPSSACWSTWKVRDRTGERSELQHWIDYVLYTDREDGRGCSLQPVSVLEPLDSDLVVRRLEEEEGEDRMEMGRLPCSFYPSDHISVGVVFAIERK